jgi:excisionase family DNA binding protein
MLAEFGRGSDLHVPEGAVSAIDTLLTTAQAAAALGVGYDRAYQLIRAGRLPAQRFGNAWVVRAVDVEAFAAVPRAQGWKKGRRRKSGITTEEK